MADNAILRRLAQLNDNGRYNADYEDSLSQILRQLTQGQSGYDLNRSRLGEDYGRATSDMARQFGEGQEALQARMADQGILRSGINVAEQGKQAGNFSRALDLLGVQQRRGLEDIDRSQTGFESGINDYISQLQRNKARADSTGALSDAQQQSQTEADNSTASRYGDQIAGSMSQMDQAEQAYNQQIQSLQPILTPTGQYATPPQPDPAPNPVAASVPAPQTSAVSRRLGGTSAPRPKPTTRTADQPYLMRVGRAY